MSGVNAHAILCNGLGVRSEAPDQAALPWRKQRCWAVPAVCMLLTSADVSGSQMEVERLVCFACRLDGAQLSYLWDHR